MREYTVKELLKPRVTTAGGVTGSWVDLQGLINPGGREVKGVLAIGIGTTAGTAGGLIQSAENTAGTGAATVITFATATSAGGTQEGHGIVRAAHRYVRFVGTVQSGKDMIQAALLIGVKRDTG